MFEIMVAYYFVVVTAAADIHQVGPFSTDTQCERTRQWLARTYREKIDGVSECWYGPALALAQPRKGS